MSTKRFKLTTSKLPKGATVVPGKTVAWFNERLFEAMNVDCCLKAIHIRT